MADRLRRLVVGRVEVPGVRVAVAPGELLDRITILQIKTERLADSAKRAAAEVQLGALRRAWAGAVVPTAETEGLEAELRAVNEALWEAEDGLRLCERQKDFGERFVKLARTVYRRNDARSRLKERVNDLLGSALGDPKDYPDYG
jgi:hypothetical protein